MQRVWALGGLIAIVAALLLAASSPGYRRVLRWLPLPLWCYALPMVGVSFGWLPRDSSVYRALTDTLLPVGLGLLLLGVEVSSVMRAGGRAVAAALIGAAGIVIGAIVAVALLEPSLPAEAWKGAGALTGTWTGGTMNLLALRSVLATPEAVFAPLIVVDAIIAYTWMALLVALAGVQERVNRWLGATPVNEVQAHETSALRPSVMSWRSLVVCALLAGTLAWSARALAAHLPTSPLVSSPSGWTVLLVTTAALGLSGLARIRRVGESGIALGYPCLYLVLAATGAQASWEALRAAPVWLVVGVGVVAVHGSVMLVAGRLLRIPLGILATASQANIGGVVSAPLVGGSYHQSLVPVGLLLAMAGNAAGTYLGMLSAWLSRAVTGS